MKEYDVYLPLCYNDGTPVEADKITSFKKLLVEKFGGLTHFPQENEGLWKFGGRTFRDKVVILRVLSNEEQPAREFFRDLRTRMQDEFEQANVLIVERSVDVVEDR